MCIFDRLSRAFTYLAIFNLHIAEPVSHIFRALRLLRNDYSTIPHPRPSKRQYNCAYSLTTILSIFPSLQKFSTQNPFHVKYFMF